MKLYTKITIGLLLGVGVGLLLGRPAAAVEPVGKAFIRLITMVVVPLVFASLVVGTASLGDVRRLGRVGGKTIVYYLATTAIAVIIGLVLANLVRPGAGLGEHVRAGLLGEYGGATQERIRMATQRPSVTDLLLSLIPTNPVKSLAEGEMLPIILFALLLGSALTMIPPERARPVLEVFDGINEAVIRMVTLIMEVAPYGVFALIAAVVGKFGAGILFTLIKYSAVVLVGLVLHMGITYSLSVRLLGRVSPRDFFRAIRPAQLIAFSTSSSNATLPVNMKCAMENMGISRQVTSFVLPLGATINMDGTALYQGVAAVFIAQVYGIPLDFAAQAMIVLTATLASVGAAGVPGAGIITLALVLQTAGIPLEGIALILGVDRILDMCRTVVNITGDQTCALFVARTEGETLKIAA